MALISDVEGGEDGGKKIKDVISIFRPRGPIGERGPNKLDANPGTRPLVALTVC